MFKTTPETSSKRRARRILVPAAAAVGAAGLLAVASAATLGGINSDSLGADEGPVVSCDVDGVDAEYTSSYDVVDGRYEVTEVTISAMNAACVGLDLEVTLTDDTGAVLATTAPVVVAGISETIPVTAEPAAESVNGIAVIISG